MIPDIADKREILVAIENALLNGLWPVPQGLEISEKDRADTRKMVSSFIEDRLSRLNARELLEKFATPEKIFNSYVAYLETKLEIGGRHAPLTLPYFFVAENRMSRLFGSPIDTPCGRFSLSKRE